MWRSCNNLPEEIILEILTRLPTESVLDCKLVCKPWRDLVHHHPSFSQIHLNRLNENDSGNKVSLLFISYNRQQDRKEFYYTEFDEEENCDEILFSRKTRMNLNPLPEDCSFVSSCNGLICFTSWNDRVKSDKYRFGPTYICNPITREYIILPNLQGEYLWNGFGYSHSTNEYKLVRICLKSTDPNFGIAQVYTVGGSNGWRSLGEMDTNWKNMKYTFICNGVFANGALHWVNNDNGTILAFHLAEEKFTKLPSPPSLTWAGVPDFTLHLGVLGDFLSVTKYHDDNCISEIWLLKKNKDNSGLSWSKEFCLDSHIQLLLSEFKKRRRLLYYSSGVIHSDCLKASSAKIDLGFDVCVYEPIPHKNTLVSLKALGEKDTKTMEFGKRARSSEVIET